MQKNEIKIVTDVHYYCFEFKVKKYINEEIFAFNENTLLEKKNS